MRALTFAFCLVVLALALANVDAMPFGHMRFRAKQRGILGTKCEEITSCSECIKASQKQFVVFGDKPCNWITKATRSHAKPEFQTQPCVMEVDASEKASAAWSGVAFVTSSSSAGCSAEITEEEQWQIDFDAEQVKDLTAEVKTRADEKSEKAQDWAKGQQLPELLDKFKGEQSLKYKDLNAMDSPLSDYTDAMKEVCMATKSTGDRDTIQKVHILKYLYANLNAQAADWDNAMFVTYVPGYEFVQKLGKAGTPLDNLLPEPCKDVPTISGTPVYSTPVSNSPTCTGSGCPTTASCTGPNCGTTSVMPSVPVVPTPMITPAPISISPVPAPATTTPALPTAPAAVVPPTAPTASASLMPSGNN